MKKFPAMKAGSTGITQRPRDSSGSMLALPDPRRPDRTKKTFDDPIFWQHRMINMHCVPAGSTVNKEYYVEVLRDFRKRFRQKRPALFKSGQWHFHQDNEPVHNFILVTDYLTKLNISLLIVQTLLPVTFGYSLSSEAVVMR